MKEKKLSFVDAQKIHREDPMTFAVPSNEKLIAIKKDDCVKVVHNGESFWVKVIKVRDDEVEGTVENVVTLYHPFKYKDTITFGLQNIYDILVVNQKRSNQKKGG